MKKYGDLEIKVQNPYGEESPIDDFETIEISHIDFNDLDNEVVIEECFLISAY